MNQNISILLVDDDEDIYVLLRDFLAKSTATTYHITWVSTFEKGLEEALKNAHEIILLDYCLGEKNGLEFLKKALAQKCTAPIVFLTNNTGHHMDTYALKMGAMDYLVKEFLSLDSLERCLRYAIERQQLLLKIQYEKEQHAAINVDFADFIRMVSFDLHTPLEHIEKETLALQQQFSGTESVQERLTRIHKASQKLHGLIESFLRLDHAH